jgi:hypothetical protein
MLRGLLLLFLLQLPFFMNGCDFNSIYQTLGFAVPYAEVDMGHRQRPDVRISVSGLGFTANLLVIGGGLLLAFCCWPWLWRQLESKSFLFVLVITVWAFDSIWFLPAVWGCVVGSAVMNLANWMQCVASGDMRQTADRGSWCYLLSARLYFLAWLIGGYLLTCGAVWLYRRFVVVTPNRWWQVSLAAVLAAMLILGTALGLLLRLLL